MNRLHRLQRTAICCGAAIVALLLFTVPASRDFVAGQPFFLWLLLGAVIAVGALGILCLWVADKVADTLGV